MTVNNNIIVISTLHIRILTTPCNFVSISATLYSYNKG